MFVALLAESVDRKDELHVINQSSVGSLSSRRAWIERQMEPVQTMTPLWSLSSRRAWIESSRPGTLPPLGTVSLSSRRAWIERISAGFLEPGEDLSLSSRRAWIERNLTAASYRKLIVALLAESVDRKSTFRKREEKSASRSPRGERG